MSALLGMIDNYRSRLDSRAALIALVLMHSTLTCLSLIKVADFQYYIHFYEERAALAITVATAFSTVGLLFAFARFSFGYFVGFYLYTLILGYLWIDSFSVYDYPHLLAGMSAAASLVLLLLPLLFMQSQLRPVLVLTQVQFDHLLTLLLVICVAVIAVAATYNFRLVPMSRIYDYRDALEFPGVIRYLVGWVSSTMLPYVFASCWLLGYRWRAALALVLLLFFYPITLTKFAFFTPAWLIMLALLSSLLLARTAVIASIFVPMFVCLVAVSLTGSDIDGVTGRIFDTVNIRMFGTPSSALDIYNHFFAENPPTWFCQISLLKPFMACPYQESLPVVMQKTYDLGNLNASLFATEGLASVGHYLAPVTALVAGFVLALGNGAAAGLPPRLVLISAGVLPHILLNVPLSVAMLTHGMAILFLLWYVTPRALFERKP